MREIITIGILYLASRFIDIRAEEADFVSGLALLVCLVSLLYLAAALVERFTKRMNRWHRITPGVPTVLNETEWKKLENQNHPTVRAFAEKAGTVMPDAGMSTPARNTSPSSGAVAPPLANKLSVPSVAPPPPPVRSSAPAPHSAANKVFDDPGYDPNPPMAVKKEPPRPAAPKNPDDDKDNFDEIFGTKT